ncbi:MAG: NfeD family protein [candidate division Zixibacteria bacterium]|nr:NfeD family protein [candidate division Zixibacteria bacterium]
MSTLFWIWMAAVVAFLIMELATPTLVFASFVVGAVGAAITATLTDSYLLQIAVFAIISIIMIPLTRPLACKITKPAPQKANVDALIGRTGVVTKKIDAAQDVGQVRVEGQVWQAVAEEVIEAGEQIRVDEIRGARLYVSRPKQEQ